MNRNPHKIWGLAVAALVIIYLHPACGGDSDYPSAPSGGGSPVGATIFITASGVSDASPRIALGQRVRFTNNDSRPHQILTTPHQIHTDCPALNLDMLQPGQSKESGALNERRGCGFHDHLNPDDQRLRGQVRVGFSQGDPDPPPSDY